MAVRFDFGNEFGEEAVAVQGRTARWHAPPRPAGLRRLSLADVAAPTRAEPVPATGPAVPAASPPPLRDLTLVLSEAELARACAAVAARTRREVTAAMARERQDVELAALDGLRRALADLAARRDQVDRAVREQVLAWTTAGLEACVGTLIAADPVGCAARVLERLLAAALPAGALTVLVHPSAVEGLRARVPALTAAAGLVDEVRVEPDPALEPGGVRLEWRDGWADHEPGVWRAALTAELRRALVSPSAADRSPDGNHTRTDGERG